MEKVAKFEKVSFDEFLRAYEKIYGENSVTYSVMKEYYDDIELPTRATKGSAGYDFKMPYSVATDGWDYVTIPTGIRCKIEEGWALMCYPKSGLGFKYGMKLANTVGIIDSDYYYSDNEGHIMAKIYTEKAHAFQRGDKFMQGVFAPFGITEDDAADGVRNGGFGSTGK